MCPGSRFCRCRHGDTLCSPGCAGCSFKGLPLSGTMECSRLRLYFPCHSPGISHLTEAPGWRGQLYAYELETGKRIDQIALNAQFVPISLLDSVWASVVEGFSSREDKAGSSRTRQNRAVTLSEARTWVSACVSCGPVPRAVAVTVGHGPAGHPGVEGSDPQKLGCGEPDSQAAGGREAWSQGCSTCPELSRPCPRVTVNEP